MSELTDHSPVPPSPRSLVAVEVARWLEVNQINHTKPARQETPRGGKRWVLQVNPPGWFAAVEVFQEDYLRVVYQRRGTPGAPEMRTYATLDECLAFLYALFVAKDPEMAAQVPQWQPRRKPVEPKTKTEPVITDGMFGPGND